jgi:hypothetical protein
MCLVMEKAYTEAKFPSVPTSMTWELVWWAFLCLVRNKWKGNEIQPHMLCSSLHDEDTKYRLLSFAVYLLIDSSTSRLSLSIALVKCNNKLRTQILYNGYCQFWAKFVESHKIVVFTKNNDLWSYDNIICWSKGFNNLINHFLFSIKFHFLTKKLGICVCVCVCVYFVWECKIDENFYSLS